MFDEAISGLLLDSGESASRRSKSASMNALPVLEGASSQAAVLLTIHGDRFGHRFAITDDEIVIGRGLGCAFRVRDPAVSRRHCAVWQQAGRSWVRDLGSTNNTLVNNRVVQQTELVEGDSLCVGQTLFRVVRVGPLGFRYHPSISRLSTLDGLTRVLSRAMFLDSLESAVCGVRDGGGPLALLFLDLDHFKCINDESGHAMGDVVLRRVGQVLRRSTRAGESAGRLGGGKFAFVLPGATSDVARLRAEEVRQAVANLSFMVADRIVPITVSVGATVWNSHLQSMNEFMREADVRLYRAKANGRNRVCAD